MHKSLGRMVHHTATLLLAAPLALSAATPMISAQDSHTLALSRDGTVYSWGDDSSGQLGLGRQIYSATPRKIDGLPKIAFVAGSGSTNAAIDVSGNVWTWGSDSCGQLGPRSSSVPTLPGRVLGISAVKQVAAAGSFTVALRTDGTVWMWGSLSGCGINSSAVPTPIAGLTNIVDVRAGREHLVALRSDGTVWTVGENIYGQLGDGTTQDRATVAQVPGLSSITKIGANFVSSTALRADGTVFAWGSTYPDPSSTGCCYKVDRVSPLPVNGLTGVVDVYGDSALKADGTVATWYDSYSPTLEAGLTDIRSFSRHYTANVLNVGIQSTGALVISGTHNAYGERGLGNVNFTSGVTTVPGLGVVKMAALSDLALLAVNANGDLYAWGSNLSGQLALGDTLGKPTPSKLAGLPAIAKVAAGALVSYALDANGKVWGWGSNCCGQLGFTGSFSPSSTPILLAGLDNIVDVAAGSGVGYFLKNDGTVWYLGYPISGFVTATPKQVAGLPPVAAIFGTPLILFAVTPSGQAYSWGIGPLLGDGQTTSTMSAIPVTAFNAPVTSISATQSHALARTADGGLWSWGNSYYGALGNNVQTPLSQNPLFQAVPARVPGIGPVTAVAAGPTHSLALLVDGRLKSWGTRALGDGATVSRATPGDVSTLSAVTGIAAGPLVSYAVGHGGIAFGWGPNGVITSALTDRYRSTAIGDGTFAGREAPVAVLRENALGNIDTNDWFLDLDSTLPNQLPPALQPAIVPVASGEITTDRVTLSARINFRTADTGKKVGTYVLGVVPPTFFDVVKPAPKMTQEKRSQLKAAGDPVLVQLTPLGWTTVDGQLVAFSSGVVNGNGGANNILNGIPLVQIPGARFCIGYGESASDMLTRRTLQDVLALEGAARTVNGLPCILSGVFVSGPLSSYVGTPVTFTANVVGFAPAGTVQFQDWASALGAPLQLQSQNEALSTQTITTSSLTVGAHAISATYAGQGLNPASSAATPVDHRVYPLLTAVKVVLAGANSSVVGDTVSFSVRVLGNAPTGSVRLKNGTAVMGAANLFDGDAIVSVSGLLLGPYQFVAEYLGDGANQSATSAPLDHTVYSGNGTVLVVSATPSVAASSTPVLLRAAVRGNSPTGNVTFSSEGSMLGVVPLANGEAQLTVPAFAPGLHVVTAAYPGDGNNAAISDEVVVQVSAPGSGSTPQPFNFVSLPNATPGVPATSNVVHITGISAPATVVVQGGRHSIGCTSAFTTLPSTISSGQAICVQHDTSPNNAEARSTTLTVGGVSSTFTTTTYAAAFFPNLNALVAHYYQSILRRAPDGGGNAYWVLEAARLASEGASVNEAFYAMAISFFGSAEYLGLAQTDQAYVTDLYNAFFNRAPDAGGLAFWTGQLAQGLPRQVVLTQFMFSTEFRTFMESRFGTATARPEVDVAIDFYRGLLGRLPDTDGLRFWVGRFRGAQCAGSAAVVAEVESISKQFADGAEYTSRGANNARFVGDLYNAFLRRGGDLAGVNSWIGDLAAGRRTRDEMRKVFIGTPEFGNRVNALLAQPCAN